MMNKKTLFLLFSLPALFLGNERRLDAQPVARVENPVRNSAATVSGTRFIRLTSDKTGSPESLQTSITRYQSDDGKLLVDLIGVIHVGEKNYYRKLNHQFQLYDSMLYELVAPPESRVPQRSSHRRASSNPIGWIQNSMQRMLALESQLNHIDYTQSNFVHADLSPSQLQDKMAERGDTPLSVGLQALSEMMKQANQKTDSPALGLSDDIASFDDLFSLLNNPHKIKIMMAQQFASNNNLDAGLGSTLNQLLITDRNQAAMKVLKSEIDKGQKRIGIFYGAAHMPDFEKRLISDFQLKKTKQAWVSAWDLTVNDHAAKPANNLSNMLFQLLDSLE